MEFYLRDALCLFLVRGRQDKRSVPEFFKCPQKSP